MGWPQIGWASTQRPGNPIDKLVLMILADSANIESGCVFLKVETLAELCEIDRKTALAALQRIIALGLIEDTMYRVGRTFRTKVYRVKDRDYGEAEIPGRPSPQINADLPTSTCVNSNRPKSGTVSETGKQSDKSPVNSPERVPPEGPSIYNLGTLEPGTITPHTPAECASPTQKSGEQREPELPGVAKPKRTKANYSERASRLPEDWEPSPEIKRATWNEHKGVRDRVWFYGQLRNFRDYWLSAGGPGARKVDWNRAWSRWVREEIKREDEKASRFRRPSNDEDDNPLRRFAR